MTTAQTGGSEAAPLRVFLAIPGSDFGPGADWGDPDQIKRRFYDVIASKLQEKLGRTVDLVVEKEKRQAGSIYKSMYSEAWLADVYLADLTGANANVYLELGVRWAMSDGVTILLAQDPSKLKFNVVAARAERYSNDPDILERAINRVVESIVNGLASKARGESDSPVRDHSKVLSISAEELAELRTEVERLRSERGEDYLNAAAITNVPEAKVEMLRRAVEINPLVAENHFHLGQALREIGSADVDAIYHLERAADLSPDVPSFWRELGVVLSKSGNPEQAIKPLRRAIQLDPNDFDAVSTLGGARRRLALLGAPDHVDRTLLEEARESYEIASKLAPRDSYPLLNLARIDLILSSGDTRSMDTATALFKKALPLCMFEREEAREIAIAYESEWSKLQDAAYKAFDYADCLLFSGKLVEGVEAYRESIDAVPQALRTDIFRSVLAGLDSIDTLAPLNIDTADAVKQVRSILNAG